MRWELMQKPLREGLQAFRQSWPDDTYAVVEDNQLTLYTAEHPEGVPYVPSDEEFLAEDWAATGPSGE